MAFNRSASTNTDTSGSKQTFNERHSRDKIENFLKEVKTKDGINTNQLAKAWEEYISLMKNEKTLAYKYPKQFFETLKTPQNRRRLNLGMLDQSPLSKLIANNIGIPSREGAQIQFESLQASDQQLSYIVRKKDIILPPDVKSPDDSDINLYPEGCEDCGKQAIINLFDIGVNDKVLTALHKREYVKLVCKEATLKKEFPEKHKRIDLEFDDDVENFDINELERKMPKKGPLYEFIKYYINGNNERIAKMSLQEYYILSSAEDLLFQCDPNSEWTYRYPEDISASSDVPQAGASPSDVNKFQFRNKIEDIGRHLGSDQMAGTYPLPGRNFPQTQREPDERNNFSNSIIGITGSESGKKVLKKQSNIINEPNSLEPESQYSQVKPPGTQYSNIRPPGTHNSFMQPPGTQDWNTRPSETQNSSMRPSGTHNSNRRPPGTQDSQTRPAKRTVERQNSNSQSSAFGAIADPGDKNVTNWKDAYSDLHKCWSYQNSQIEELTSRLSSFASKQLTEGNAAFTDLSDKNRPTKIGERFGLIFDDEWSEAFEELKDGGMDDQSVISKLLQIIQHGFKYCMKKADEQLEDLQSVMKIPILQPFQIKHSLHVPKDMFQILTTATLKHAKEYRKVTASISSPEVCKVFLHEESNFLKRTFQTLSSGEKLRVYIQVCIEQLWLMCVQDPQMSLEFADPNTPIQKDLYKFHEKKGTLVHLTVWPVVFLHKGGPLVSKGYVLPK